ncbi:glucuronyl hydrolase [Flavicella sp.]|uniref:glucuronyl hydrolase n=1 Tax=Flavicella sp. TaxID=2957742 RepID=UPI00301AD8D6
MRKLSLFIALIAMSGCLKENSTYADTKLIKKIGAQLKGSIILYNDSKTDKLVSPRTAEMSAVKMVPASDWTSGFYPGELWMMYELTKNEFWKENALKFTLPIEQEKWNGKTHDMGFKMYSSFGRAYFATKNPKFRDVLIQSAKTLATRFNPNVGCIRSWDFNSKVWGFPVIIDNMMNLELLFWAAKETGNVSYKNIAIIHAKTTLKNHFRADYSSFHVVDYKPRDWRSPKKQTYQGYSDESAWSRGQAWALYGYTMVYRETGDDKYLEHAEKIATYILNHPNLPDHKIPFWDFNDPKIPNVPFDASAGAIVASALYELSTFSDKGAEYLETANHIIKTLSIPKFLSEGGSNNGFLLKHSTGSKPGNSEVDVPLVYADYYYIESLLRRKNLIKIKKYMKKKTKY